MYCDIDLVCRVKSIYAGHSIRNVTMQHN